MLRREGVTTDEPRVSYVLKPADFYVAREVAPRLGPVAAEVLGPLAKALEPLSWLATAKPAYAIDERSLFRGTDEAGVEEFGFVGGRRTKSGD